MKRALLVTVLAAGTLGLSACAFQPLYGDNGQIAAIRGVTIVIEGNERIDQMLDEALNDRFGTPGGGRYRLVAETETSTSGLGVGADDIANRSALILTVDFSLVETGTATPVMTETVQTEATFDIPTEPYAAISARRDAEERVTQEAADRIALRVARHIHRSGQ